MARYRVLLCIVFLTGLGIASFSLWVYGESAVELTWYIMRNVEEIPFWQEMADRHMEKNPQVKVNVMNELSGGVTKLTTMIASGVAPDVVRGERAGCLSTQPMAVSSTWTPTSPGIVPN
jgi:ABC-type glycerol-3-phosphate transport system substrate-binding protein